MMVTRRSRRPHHRGLAFRRRRSAAPSRHYGRPHFGLHERRTRMENTDGHPQHRWLPAVRRHARAAQECRRPARRVRAAARTRTKGAASGHRGPCRTSAAGSVEAMSRPPLAGHVDYLRVRARRRSARRCSKAHRRSSCRPLTRDSAFRPSRPCPPACRSSRPTAARYRKLSAMPGCSSNPMMRKALPPRWSGCSATRRFERAAPHADWIARGNSPGRRPRATRDAPMKMRSCRDAIAPIRLAGPESNVQTRDAHRH